MQKVRPERSTMTTTVLRSGKTFSIRLILSCSIFSKNLTFPSIKIFSRLPCRSNFLLRLDISLLFPAKEWKSFERPFIAEFSVASYENKLILDHLNSCSLLYFNLTNLSSLNFLFQVMVFGSIIFPQQIDDIPLGGFLSRWGGCPWYSIQSLAHRPGNLPQLKLVQ